MKFTTAAPRPTTKRQTETPELQHQAADQALETASEETAASVTTDANDAPHDVPNNVTDTPPSEAAAPSGFSVRDRRFWARTKADVDVDAAATPNSEAETAPSKPTYVQELEKQLADKEARLQATLAQYKEALDDFESAKARLRRDIGKEIGAGKRAILAGLLDVLDNLDRALDAPLQAPESATTALRHGVSMVRDQFLQKLENLGVTKVPLLGKPFDPSLSEAVSMVPVSDAAQAGKVLAEIRTCYIMEGTPLRHGVVAVGQSAATPSPTAAPQSPAASQPKP